MVHNSRQLTANLLAFVQLHACAYKGAVELSAVKRDGTVFVRFKSVAGTPACHSAGLFWKALQEVGLSFTQPTEVQFRLALDQFMDRPVQPSANQG